MPKDHRLHWVTTQLVFARTLSGLVLSIPAAKANPSMIKINIFKKKTNINTLNNSYFSPILSLKINRVLLAGTRKLSAEVSFGCSLFIVSQTSRECQN